MLLITCLTLLQQDVGLQTMGGFTPGSCAVASFQCVVSKCVAGEPPVRPAGSCLSESIVLNIMYKSCIVPVGARNQPCSEQLSCYFSPKD